MKTAPCLHWFGFCGIQEKCIYKRNGECKKNGIIEHRELVMDKIENVGKRKQVHWYSGIRDLNN